MKVTEPAVETAIVVEERGSAWKRISILLNLVLLLALILTVAANLHTPLRALLIISLGRSINCPLEQAVQTYETPDRIADARARLVSSSRLLQTDSAGFNLWDTPKGRYWIPAGSDASLMLMLAEREQRIYGSGPQGVRPGDVVLDCGASIGTFTREALGAGAKLVVAIEPAAESAACLRRNFGPEIGEGRVVIYEKGVWDQDALLPLRGNFINTGEDTVVLIPGPAPREHVVQMTTIDKIVSELRLDRVDVIKMDIEGAEKQALTGAKETVRRFKPRLSIATYHLPEDAERIPQMVAEMAPGYRYECGPCELSWYRLRPKVSYFRAN